MHLNNFNIANDYIDNCKHAQMWHERIEVCETYCLCKVINMTWNYAYKKKKKKHDEITNY